MASLKENAITKIATVTNVNMNYAGTTNLYLVPVGKTLYIDSIVVRDISDSLAGGTDYAITGWRTAIDLSAMTTAGMFTVIRLADPSVGALPMTGGNSVPFQVNTGSSAGTTATVDVFGFIV